MSRFGALSSRTTVDGRPRSAFLACRRHNAADCLEAVILVPSATEAKLTTHATETTRVRGGFGRSPLGGVGRGRCVGVVASNSPSKDGKGQS